MWLEYWGSGKLINEVNLDYLLDSLPVWWMYIFFTLYKHNFCWFIQFRLSNRMNIEIAVQVRCSFKILLVYGRFNPPNTETEKEMLQYFTDMN